MVVVYLIPLVLLHPLHPLLVLSHLLLSQLTHQLPRHLLLLFAFSCLHNGLLLERLPYVYSFLLFHPLPFLLPLHKFPPPLPLLPPFIDVIQIDIIGVIDKIGEMHPDMIVPWMFDYFSIAFHLHLLPSLYLPLLHHIFFVQLSQSILLSPSYLRVDVSLHLIQRFKFVL